MNPAITPSPSLFPFLCSGENHHCDAATAQTLSIHGAQRIGAFVSSAQPRSKSATPGRRPGLPHYQDRPYPALGTHGGGVALAQNG